MKRQHYMTKKIIYLLVILFILSKGQLISQIEAVIVETYYIASINDTAHIEGEKPLIADSSITYRIFVDLAENDKVVALYGNVKHPLIFKGEGNFHNHNDRGQSFGYDIKNKSLDENSVALDSWITINYATKNHYGIPKDTDTDGSIDKIIENEDGMLQNNIPAMGTPLYEADGLLECDDVEDNFFTKGFENLYDENGNLIYLEYSTIFGDSVGNSFIGLNTEIRGPSTGLTGPTHENILLLAQITTLGELQFEINLEILDSNYNNESSYQIVKYVAKDTLLQDDKYPVKYSPWLVYPFNIPKGCKNPWFVQYDPDAIFEDSTMCLDSVVFGCMDPAACNYDPEANVELPDLCCYNSKCALDLESACPDVIYGCMDPAAANYNPDANTQSDIDTCCYKGGCTSKAYLEYDPTACYDDGSCLTPLVAGCMDTNSYNYNPFANDTTISADSCCYIAGCTNKNFLEYNPLACYNDGSCKTPVIEGCMDTAALNYNPFANKPNINICKYSDLKKGFGEDNSQQLQMIVNAYPVPCNDILYFNILYGKQSVNYSLYNNLGNIVGENRINTQDEIFYGQINMTGLSGGIYILKVSDSRTIISKKILKLQY